MPAANPRRNHGLDIRVGGAAIDIDVVPDRESVTVLLKGELDVSSVESVYAKIRELVDAGFSRLVLDLHDLSFIDSSGLHALITTSREAKAHGWQLVLVSSSPEVQRIFELTGVDDQLSFGSPQADGHTDAAPELRKEE